MKKDGLYSSGEFAKKSHVTKKTLRYYDENNYLKPTYVDENNFRFYSDQDFQKLHRIQLLKYLGFSLDEIKNMTINSSDADDELVLGSMKVQLSLLEERIEQMKVVKEIMEDAIGLIEKKEEVNWSWLMESISLTGLENSLKQQYLNTSNISARIKLHNLYSRNNKGWFEWIYENIDFENKNKVLELGSGSGKLWKDNLDKLPKDIEICLSDLSEGMVRELKRNIVDPKNRFKYEVIDMHQIKKVPSSFDIVIANHVLFYASNVNEVIEQIYTHLKPGGVLIAGTYGANHMKEISDIVNEYDSRIVLAANKLSDVFGKENGKEILKKYFEHVSWEEYEDELNIKDPGVLGEYIISCHGNQNQFIVDNYNEFIHFLENKIGDGLRVTKEAGIFIAYKKR